MSRILALLLLTLPGLFHSSLLIATPDSSVAIVATRHGLVRGMKTDSLLLWKGIRYAKKPMGELRFRAPQPPESWQGVKDAVKAGPISPQTRRLTKDKDEQGEDCLSLNIWSPAADGKKRPVMFWIHGGGFLVGSGTSPLYDGSSLAKKGDVVVVTINYRMGALGFLYLDSLAGAKGQFDNNLGIRDQIAALTWVKENIAAFGGDPQMVTIFGESAGAISVMTLMGTPAAHGLFKRAIAESGAPESLWHPQTATWFTLRYLKMLNISPDHIERLKLLPTDTLINTMDKLITELGHESSQVKILEPTIDGTFIPTDLMTAIKTGKAAGVDLMIGTNKDESTILSIKRIGLTPRSARALAPYLEQVDQDSRRKLCAAYKNYPRKSGVCAMSTDGIFAMPSINLSEYQSAHATTYMYRFDWSSFPLRVLGLRACHGLELPFVFGTTDKGPGRFFTTMSNRKVVHRLSAQIQQHWINFARYGNPDPSGQSGWRAYQPEGRSTMIFDKSPHTFSDPNGSKRMAWSGVSIFK